jgi:hypothetical protein
MRTVACTTVRSGHCVDRQHTLRVLSPAECFDLLESAVVGRVGFTSADGVTVYRGMR